MVMGRISWGKYQPASIRKEWKNRENGFPYVKVIWSLQTPGKQFKIVPQDGGSTTSVTASEGTGDSLPQRLKAWFH